MQASMFTIVRDTIQYISLNTEYDFDTMETHMNAYLQRCGKCSGTSKSGKTCMYNAVPGSLVCKRHTKSNELVERVQCQATTSSGNRCIRDAKPSHALCGIHIGTKRRRDRTEHQRGCIYYDLSSDTNEYMFCEQSAIHQQWCCKSHAHLNSLYERTYGCANLSEYESDESIRRNPVIEEFLKSRNVHLAKSPRLE